MAAEGIQLNILYLLNKITELPSELIQYMLHNHGMICLTFSYQSDLMLNETSYVRQTEIRIYALVPSYQADAQRSWNQSSPSLYLQFELDKLRRLISNRRQFHVKGTIRQSNRQDRLQQPETENNAYSKTWTQLRSHMLLICTEIDASVPIPCFSIKEISSLSLR